MAKKKKFTVSGTLTISVSTEVEASSAKEAIAIASGRDIVRLCHQCARGDPDAEFITSGELDGEPDDLVAEES